MRQRLVLLGVSLAMVVGLYAADPHVFNEAQRSFWSLQPVKKQVLPAVKDQSWVKSPIDAFVLAKLEEKELSPNTPADRLTVLRRATLDMTGLLPTREEIQHFQNDQSPDAWKQVVDRLLASPAYGERWARHWLDVARYADSDGFKVDGTRPNIWRYRDYVIKAFNQDKPYDRFVKEQIAGDELYPGDPEALVAMGFNRHWAHESNANALHARRQETLDDMTSVTAQAFLGLTFGCARCHDHKYDPILQKDYYRLQAFFANTSYGDGPLPLTDRAAQKKYEESKAAWEEKTKDIRAEMAKIEEPLLAAQVNLEPDVQASISLDAAKRDPIQAMLYHTAKKHEVLVKGLDVRSLKSLKDQDAKRYAELKKNLAEFDFLKPAPLPEAQFMVDLGVHAPPTHILRGGNWDAPGDEVQPGFLSILNPADAKVTPLGNSTGRRSVLAAWLADPANPLVARVMVNRIWTNHFGRGIVATPGDFGRMGAKPTHPELLDFLAAEFKDNGWSMKKIHRMILLSNTYQQSSDFQAKSAEADPDNKLIWRYERHRMEAEAMRDSMLQVSGLLNPRAGGPGVYPPLPPGTMPESSAALGYLAGAWVPEKDPGQNNRRSIYIFVRRNLRYPMMQEFDSANGLESCDLRRNTVTPLQSLDLLNNSLVLDWAQALAGRILDDSGLTPAAQVERAFKLTYGREPSVEEQKIALEFLASQSSILAKRLADGAKIKPRLPTSMPSGMDPARAAALVDLSHMLIDSNEFLYVN